MGVVRVRRMAAGDMDAVATVLGLAFADQPNTLAMVQGDTARARRFALEGMRVAKLGRVHKNLWVAEDGPEIVGALNGVEWPHCQLSIGEKARTAPRLVLSMGSAVPRAMKLMSAWAKRDPRERHWHLGPIGVRPDLQGQGIGKAMMAAVLAAIDAQGSPTYLETDRARNLPFYEAFGFRITGEEEILGVPNWYLWRDAFGAVPGGGPTAS